LSSAINGIQTDESVLPKVDRTFVDGSPILYQGSVAGYMDWED